jgi:hypothetical protein
VRFTEVGTPVASSDWQDTKFGDNNGGTNRSGDFFRGLDTQTNVTLGVTNNHNCLEASTLTGTRLLLDGFDLNIKEILLVSIEINLISVSVLEYLLFSIVWIYIYI